MISAIHTGKKLALVGAWITTEDMLLLAWGKAGMLGGASAAAAGTTGISSTPAPAPRPDLSGMPKLKATPNVATGWVADHHGRPVPGAQVTVYALNNAGKDQYTVVKTDARGVYRAPLTAAYVYEVEVTTRFPFDDNTFRLPCNPVQTSLARSGRQGIVQNFVLAFTGIKNTSDAEPTESKSYLGARIWLYYFPKTAPSRDAMVHVTLEPVGTPADGRPTRTLAFTRTVDDLSHNDGDGRALHKTRMLHDIPLGVYRMSAWIEEPGAGRRPLRMYAKPDGEGPTETAESVVIRFAPNGTWGGIGTTVVTLKDPE